MFYLITCMYIAAVGVSQEEGKREAKRDLARTSTSEADTEATPPGFPGPGWTL